jgi:hypothetical protein
MFCRFEFSRDPGINADDQNTSVLRLFFCHRAWYRFLRRATWKSSFVTRINVLVQPDGSKVHSVFGEIGVALLLSRIGICFYTFVMVHFKYLSLLNINRQQSLILIRVSGVIASMWRSHTTFDLK